MLLPFFNSSESYVYMVSLTLGSAITLILTVYQVVEREIRSAYERLKEIRSCRLLDYQKIESAIDAQEHVLRILGACKVVRCILIRLPGLMVIGMVATLLCMLINEDVKILWLSSLIGFLILVLIGSIIIFYAIHKWPEATYIKAKLKEIDVSKLAG